MLCKLCASINATDLVHLAKTNYGILESKRRDGEDKADSLYWRHHRRYDDLVAAARADCELCQHLLHAMDEVMWNHLIGHVTYKDLLLELEKNGSSLGFHVTIDSVSRDYHGCIGPALVPLSRGADLRSNFAADEPLARSNTLGISSASATWNATLAPVRRTESDSLRSKPTKIKPTEYKSSYKGILLNRLSFNFRSKNERLGDDMFRPLVLSLQVPREKAKFVGPIQIGHFSLDPNLGSEANFNIARSWIKTCGEEHHQCPPMDDKRLPTRVINVGSDDREPFLVTTNQKKGKFIALSHCWGGAVPEKAKLTSKTAELFKERIPMADLPANFVDAILITRTLGFDYLWIDCLCILQDSHEDWDIESKHMGNVYRDAVVTLAAAAASKATEGMLHTFTEYDLNGGPSIKLQLSQKSSPGDAIDVVRLDNTREDLGKLLLSGPLANRGWTLQEEILSPRTLFYGFQQIHWQCIHHHSSGDGIHDHNVNWRRAFRYEWIKDRIFKQTHSPAHHPHDPKNVSQILMEYHNDMVVDYCSRKLTFPTDKFPAFSGIASLMHGELRHAGYVDAAYLAGIWSSHFREGLLWYYGKGATPSITDSHSQVLSFPSWSWVMATGRIESLYIKTLLHTHLDPLLISHNVIPASNNPYGAIQSAELVVLGYTLPMRESDRGAKYSSGDVYWDPSIPSETGTSRGLERKSDVWLINRGGETWLVIGTGYRGTARHENNETKAMEEINTGDLKKLPFEVLFIASHARYAYGLILEEVKTKIGDAPSEADTKADAEADAKANHRVKETSKTSSKTPNITETDATTDMLGNTKFQDDDLGVDADLDSGNVRTYRRIGLIKLQLKVATKKRNQNQNQNQNRFGWMDIKWERRKLRLM